MNVIQVLLKWKNGPLTGEKKNSDKTVLVNIKQMGFYTHTCTCPAFINTKEGPF